MFCSEKMIPVIRQHSYVWASTASCRARWLLSTQTYSCIELMISLNPCPTVSPQLAVWLQSRISSCRLQFTPTTSPAAILYQGGLDSPICTSLQADAWEAALSDHPDHTLTNCLLKGVHQGFCKGFDLSLTATLPPLMPHLLSRWVWSLNLSASNWRRLHVM